MRVERVLVVGGGLAGLSVGIAFARAGSHVEIIEKADEWADVGAGMYLPGNAHRAMEALGIGSEVRDSGFQIRRQVFRDRTGRTLAEVDLQDVWGSVGPCLAITRADLHRTLRDAATGVDLRLGVEVVAIDQDGESAKVDLTDGSSGEFDLLVGADGLHSSVRRHMTGRAEPSLVGQVSWRFIVNGDADLTNWTVMLGGAKTFLAVPLGGSRTYCYLDLSSNDGTDPTRRDPDRLQDVFGDFAAPASGLIRAASESEPVHFGAIEEVVTDDWVAGRVVLVGDAAHATSPNMAQGAAMAFEDAVVLAQCLAGQATVREALGTYVTRRLPRIRWVRGQTHRRDRIRSLPAPVRNLSLRLAGNRIYRSNYAPLMTEP
ncbi:MAG TPA: FAD-dependent monooxygenase [Acidimicrobiia bacterium]|nr:FAD-dependent monooxygenase [Acidimicrobiia bacterium]